MHLQSTFSSILLIINNPLGIAAYYLDCLSSIVLSCSSGILKAWSNTAVRLCSWGTYCVNENFTRKISAAEETVWKYLLINRHYWEYLWGQVDTLEIQYRLRLVLVISGDTA